MNDQLSSGCLLSFDQNVVKMYPWAPNSSSNINLVPGNNVCWIRSDAGNASPKIGYQPVNVAVQKPVTLKKFNDLVEPVLENICKLEKILKVIGTKDAKKTTEDIVNYFKDTEKSLKNRSTESTTPDKKISEALKGLLRTIALIK